MVVLEEGQTPLVVAYDVNQAAYVLFAYGERQVTETTTTNTVDPAETASGGGDGSDAPTTPKQSTTTPYLIQHKLDASSSLLLPADLKPYLAPYPIRQLSPDQQQHPTGDDDGLAESYPPQFNSLTIINSVTSGGANQSSSIYSNVLKPLLERFGVQHEYIETESADTIPNLARSLVPSSNVGGGDVGDETQQQVKTVLVMGGDTSIVEFANALTDPKPSRSAAVAAAAAAVNIVCIPTGSGNAISLSLGHTSVPHSISRFFLGTLQPLANFKVVFPSGASVVKPDTELPTTVPTTDADGRFAAVGHIHTFAVASWGLHAALVADSDSAEYRRKYPGIERFKKAAEDNMTRPQTYSLTANLAPSSTTTAVRVNGPPEHRNQPLTTLTGTYSYFNFLLVNQLEKGYLISPATQAPSSLDLHLVAVPYQESVAELGKIVMAPYSEGAHIGMDTVEYVKVSKAKPNASNDGKEEEEEVVAAVVAPQETEPMKQRWCLDGQVVLVPASQPGDLEDRKVRIYAPSYVCNGWKLSIVV